jgi:hypothetical protein
MKNGMVVFSAILCASLLLSDISSGTGKTDEQTQREIAAVKAFIARYAPGASVSGSTTAAVSSSAKYDAPPGSGLAKISGQADRKHFFMNGNKIATELYNYGGIGPGYGALRGVVNFVWHNLDYVFQFGPLVGASVPNPALPGKRLHIISDGLWDYPGLREVNPTGDTLWMWQPLPGYADPDQPMMASNPADDANGDGKPDSWPRTWYNGTLGKYVWPGYLSQDALSADLEVFWAMDDRDNKEFPYYPFPNDTSRKGLGVQVDGRAFQWSNALAENTIFFVYTITNTSDKNIDTAFYGIYGDPDLGGASPENTDDNGYFIPPYDSAGAVKDIPAYSRSMVYFWDPDMKGARGLALGYLGCKFLESPGNPNNGIDDDGDGMIDERQDDGIDNDKDWNVLNDDLGVDGIANTLDEGEGDRVPTAGKRLADGSLDPLHPGEPNFELTDLDESDQIGLTSFNSWPWNSDKVSNDESMWNRSLPRNFGQIQQNSDIVFIYGSGYISLKKGETKRISSALLLAQTLDGLLTTAKTVQTIYNKNYQFFRPPLTPTLRLVPDDRKVTLYWDTAAESSIDPITGKDFQGYVIYRSTDPTFNDIQVVTDGKGSNFLSRPLTDLNGMEAKFDVDSLEEPYTDLNNNGKYDTGESYVDVNHDARWSGTIADPWKGYHPVPYEDRGVQYYLGNNRGLVHSYVDTNNVINGQTYYYAVVAYDRGDSVAIPPTETSKKITEDPITMKYKYDLNTGQAIPGPRSGGYVAPTRTSQNVTHDAGIGTGTIQIDLLDDLAIKDGGEYRMTFADSATINTRLVRAKNYSVLNAATVTEAFVAYDTNYAALGHASIADDAVLKVTGTGGVTYTKGVDYVLNSERGAIRRTGRSGMPNNGTFTVTYRYYPVFKSVALKNQDVNAVFEGVRLEVKDDPELSFDVARSKWVEGNTNFGFTLQPASLPRPRKKNWPADYEIRFSSQNIDSATILLPTGQTARTPVRYKVRDVTTGTPVTVPTFLVENSDTRDEKWSPGEEIILFKPGTVGTLNDTITWGVVIAPPTDSTITPRLPSDGDVLLIKTTRPFDTRDVFTLKTEGYRMSTVLATSRLDKVFVVPNPYVGLNDIEPTNLLPGQTRGERRIYFENLPQRCTIRIFTLSGDLVTTLEHDSGVDNAREYWNLLNRDGFSVAYGVYVAHIDAPGVGEKMLKFALIK